MLVCYVDHHDRAYDWAARRRLEVHPRTGAAQLVELRETVQEIVVRVPVSAASANSAKPLPFTNLTDDELLGIGVPEEWMQDVRDADEDSILNLADHLPAEAAEALLEVAVGGQLPSARRFEMAAPDVIGLQRALEHPDAMRRFRLVADVDELQRALDSPWDQWTVFLHSEQKALIERNQNGPTRVSGSAGTGKTVVALHRAVYLARANPDGRVLLATFSDPLANALHTRLRRLVGDDPRLADRIDVSSLDAVAERLYRSGGGSGKVIDRSAFLKILLDSSAEEPAHRFSHSFLAAEWDHVVDAWCLTTWEAYRDVVRLGRRTRLHEERRRQLWAIFERVLGGLQHRGLMTPSMLFTTLAQILIERRNQPYDFAVIDEAQDLGVSQLRFLAAMGAHRPDALFFAGDLGQRIFQQPFSWKALGVDVRGRAATLHVNYRTSHQIRMQADKLLGQEVVDADGNIESRAATISLFNGLPPDVGSCATEAAEIAKVAAWLSVRLAEGLAPHEIGIFVRAEAQLSRATRAAEAARLPFKILDRHLQVPSGYASVGTMHFSKGLEFKAVVVMACDDSVLPLQERMEAVGEDGDLRETYGSERQLLYVACTRARDLLLVSGVAPVSEFLADMG